jgi:hypothetical protein
VISTFFRRHRAAALAAALVIASAIGAWAAMAAMGASSDGAAPAGARTINGMFCTTKLCISVTTSDGQTAQSPNGLSLRPGTYWLTVTDTSAFHDFVLRSCPGSTSPCDQGSKGDELSLTTVGEGSTAIPVVETLKINLKHGTYRLFCNAPMGSMPSMDHEAMGMYVDLSVGGVGQVG